MSQTKPIQLGGSILGRHRHVCAFFNSKEEEYRVLLPFIREGLDQGDRVFQIVDQQRHAEHVQRLEEAGIDVSDVQRTEQMEIRHWEEAYLQDGYFDCHRQLSVIGALLDKGKTKGFPRTRVMGGADWAMVDRPGAHELIEYECGLNHLLVNYKAPVCCIYDVNKFIASLIMDAIRVHPAVIIGGIYQENPFYVPPDEFLLELHDRGKDGNAAVV
jgi:hypothetical protein